MVDKDGGRVAADRASVAEGKKGNRWEMRPRLADFRIVFGHAESILRDASRCRSPARLALLELGLEELGAAGKLWLRVLAEDSGMADWIRGHGALPDLPPDAPRPVRLIHDNIGELDDKSLRAATEEHPGSLQGLQVLAQMLDAGLGAMRDMEQPPRDLMRRIQFSHRILVSLLRIPGVRPQVLRGISKTNARLSALDIPELDEIKKAALYARLDQAGRAALTPVPPETELSLKLLAESVTSQLRVFVAYHRLFASLFRRSLPQE